jgi:hypothetical protein
MRYQDLCNSIILPTNTPHDYLLYLVIPVGGAFILYYLCQCVITTKLQQHYTPSVHQLIGRYNLAHIYWGLM